MKKLALAALLSMALPALANHGATAFHAFLTGYQEVPSVSSKADAVFQAQLSSDGNSVNYTLVYEGLQADVTQAHIHFAQRSVNGPIIVWLCQTTTNPAPAGQTTVPTCPGRGGTVTGTFSASNVLASPATQQLAAGELAEIIDAMRAGVAYVNIHSAVSTGGEIRGQVHPGRAR